MSTWNMPPGVTTNDIPGQDDSPETDDNTTPTTTPARPLTDSQLEAALTAVRRLTEFDAFREFYLEPDSTGSPGEVIEAGARLADATQDLLAELHLIPSLEHRHVSARVKITESCERSAADLSQRVREFGELATGYAHTAAAFRKLVDERD